MFPISLFRSPFFFYTCKISAKKRTWRLFNPFAPEPPVTARADLRPF